MRLIMADTIQTRVINQSINIQKLEVAIGVLAPQHKTNTTLR